MNQPRRQEIIAAASGDLALQTQILSLKRNPTRDLDHDNLKYSGQKFLLDKTCEELNTCTEFARFKPATQQIHYELLRSKIKEFQDIAVAAREDSIDHRNVSLIFIDFKMKITCFLQIESSGRSI